jgi:hypothetical protein
LKLLRAGANVVVSSRNIDDMVKNYELESDYNDWKERLLICPISFDVRKINALIADLLNYTHSI